MFSAPRRKSPACEIRANSSARRRSSHARSRPEKSATPASLALSDNITQTSRVTFANQAPSRFSRAPPGEEVVQSWRARLRRHDLLIPLAAGPVSERDQDLDQRVGEPEHPECPPQGIR